MTLDISALLVLLIGANVCFAASVQTSITYGTFTTSDPILPDENKGLSYGVSAVTRNCTLFAADEEISDVINDHLASGVNLIKLYVELPNSEKVINHGSTSPVFKPLYWVRNPGRIGNGLLLLRPEYDVLSLMTLELQVVTLNVKISTAPLGCLSSLNQQNSERLLRALVMDNFRNTSSDNNYAMKPAERVCNIHATNSSGSVDFRYLCCHRDSHDYIHCSYLEKDLWLNVLFASIVFFKVLVILFSPRFIPDSLYRIKKQDLSYRHTFPEEESLTLKVLLTKTPSSFQNRARNTFLLSRFRAMKTFKERIKGLSEDQPYEMVLKKIWISVSRERLFSGESAPVGLASALYNAFVNCQIKERPSLVDCCRADMLSKLPVKTECSFYNFCKESMKVFLLLLLTVPWILRVVAYYEYEHDEMTMRKEAASQRGLMLNFPGSVILWLTPIHGLFICTYIILSIEMGFFGVTYRVSSNTSVHMKFVIRKCFRDMREMDNTKAVAWAIKLMLRPCTEYGLMGLCAGFFIWPLVLPVVIVILGFYVFPTVNITFRLFYNLFTFLFPCKSSPQICVRLKDFLHLSELQPPDSLTEENQTVETEVRKHPGYQLMIIIFCLISMYSIILLLVELVSFLAEIIIYTAMGMILNAGTIMTFLSLLLLLGLYGYECFGHVTNTFLAFNKKMLQIVLGLASEKVENVIYTKDDKQNNVSFRVKTAKCSDLGHPVTLTRGIDGRPSWTVSRLLLFLDKSDEPFIPAQFYSNACKMDYYAVPGELLIRYLHAAREFGGILLFLIFVMFVVLAFGDSYKISATNKLLATVLGGFVPLLLRKVVFKSHAVPEIDTSSIHFQVSLTDLIEPYEEIWPVADIDPEGITGLESFDGDYDLVIDTKHEEVKKFSERVQLI